MLLGFVSLLLIAFWLINPIAEEAIVDPKTQIIMTIDWPKKSIVDIDIWVKGPDGTVVSYQSKDGKYMVLERDDLGRRNDTIVINGETIVIERNMETLIINKAIPGEYVVNIHNYTTSMTTGALTGNRHVAEAYPTPVKIRILQVDPFEVVLEREATLHFRKEKTMLTFEITEDNKIVDKRTDIEIPLFR